MLRNYLFVVALLFVSIICNLLLLLEKAQLANLDPCVDLKATGYRTAMKFVDERSSTASTRNDAPKSKSHSQPDSLEQAIRYHSAGPRPPVAFVRPLCEEPCATLAANAIRAIYEANGIYTTSQDADPWTLLIANTYRGLPKLTKIWQRTNAIPGLLDVCLAERLCRLIRDAKKRFGEAWTAREFAPRCYVLPEDGDVLRQVAAASGASHWLWRSAGSKRGRGARARILNDVTMALQLQQPKNDSHSLDETVVTDQYPVGLLEEYIGAPLLVNNKRKHTLRIYALIQSFDPLQIYVYERGEVFFASWPYEYKDGETPERCMHFDVSLTRNCSRPDQEQYPDIVLYWSLDRYWTELQHAGVIKSPDFLWGRIKDVVTQAGLLVASTVLSHWEKTYSRDKMPGKAYWRNGFSLVGFDVIVDETKRPWIVDIDCGPGLSHLGSKSELLKVK